MVSWHSSQHFLERHHIASGFYLEVNSCCYQWYSTFPWKTLEEHPPTTTSTFPKYCHLLPQAQSSSSPNTVTPGISQFGVSQLKIFYPSHLALSFWYIQYLSRHIVPNTKIVLQNCTYLGSKRFETLFYWVPKTDINYHDQLIEVHDLGEHFKVHMWSICSLWVMHPLWLCRMWGWHFPLQKEQDMGWFPPTWGLALGRV